MSSTFGIVNPSHDRLADGCLAALPPAVAAAPGADAVRFIDVLWIAPAGPADGGAVAAAFEVEHTTSIYSGIVRLLHLALSAPALDPAVAAGTAPGRANLYLFAPDSREGDVREQLARPAFSRVADIGVC